MSVKYFKVDLERVVETTKRVLERFEFSEIAIVFDSVLRRRVVRDIDIGLLLSVKPSLSLINEIASNLKAELKIPVDVMLLNEALTFSFDKL